MSLDYELANKLKDAGFPQADEMEIARGDKHGRRLFEDNEFPDIPEEAYAPTLEELIEEVERDGWFGFTLEHNHLTHEWDAWIIENVGHKSLFEATVLQSGPTPTEAVAMLWLALDKPSETE